MPCFESRQLAERLKNSELVINSIHVENNYDLVEFQL